MGGGAGQSRISPSRTLEATIEDHNLVIRSAASSDLLFQTHDGAEGRAYTLGSVVWSPDSRRVAVYRVVPGFQRLVHYVESSPQDQRQPRHFTRNYTKPGDRLAVSTPVLIDLDVDLDASLGHGTAREVDDALFPDAYSMAPLRWRDDGREITLEYNERGHGIYRVIGIDPATARARVIVDETAETFFHYTPSAGSWKRFRYDLADGRHYVVSWSRVDLPPVTELRRTEDAGVVAELGRGDASALLARGGFPPKCSWRRAGTG